MWLLKFFLVFILILFIIMGVFGAILIIAPNDQYVDVETSKRNFIEYNDQINNIFKTHGYSPEKMLDNMEETNNLYSVHKSYSLDGVKYCSISMSNKSGKELYSITISSPHVEDNSYEYTKLLYDLSNVLSGYHFTEKDIEDVVKGKNGFRSCITRESELIEGQHAHHKKWVGFFSDWGIDYELIDNNPLYSPNLCDELMVFGLTKAGTK